MENNNTLNVISEFITEKSLASLGTCAVVCALITESFKMFLSVDPIIINLVVAMVLSLSKLLISEDFTVKNVILSIINIFPIALTASGGYDILKDIKIEGMPDITLQEIFDTEYDPALGNGGLGRLAACYLDSLASLGIPGFGYGINYQFGLFKQKFENGYQVEQADSWQGEDSPWQFARNDRKVLIPIHGNVEVVKNADGKDTFVWMNTQHFYGVPFDFPVVGYDGKSVNYLRLFSAKTDDELDINIFNEGGYIEAVKEKIGTETISRVLYPSDSVESGKALRLVQQYFFVSCAVQDIIRRFLEKCNDFHKLPDYACIQLNDTHPALAIVEMMRLLMDVYGQEWDTSWDIVTHIFAYTNHTLLPEALETWPTFGRHFREVSHKLAENRTALGKFV